MSLALYANLGAEERTARGATADRNVTSAACLWRLLFPTTAELVDLDTPVWPAALCTPPDSAVFDWMPREGVEPWFRASEEAVAAIPARLRAALTAGPEPACAASVHDKAFAQRMLPRALEGCSAVFEPRDLADPDAVLARIGDELRSWPAPLADDVTLKPRFGSSGRGRVSARRGEPYAEQIRRALPRLAQCGGFVLEPWLERHRDLSVSLYIPASSDEGIVLIGSLRQLATRSGVCRGHYGEMDSRGRVFSGSRWDEAIREAAVEIATAARERGYWGPCGTDAFSFASSADPTSHAEEFLRPVVEFNARYTMGCVAIGLARRALPRFKAELALEPGMRVEFVLALAPPSGAAGWSEVEARLPAARVCIPLDEAGAATGPALIACRELGALEQLADEIGLRRDRTSAGASRGTTERLP